MADNAETASSSEAGFRQRIVEFPGDNDESTVGTLDIALPSPRPENMSAAGGGEEAADDPPSLVVIEDPSGNIYLGIDRPRWEKEVENQRRNAPSPRVTNQEDNVNNLDDFLPFSNEINQIRVSKRRNGCLFLLAMDMVYLIFIGMMPLVFPRVYENDRTVETPRPAGLPGVELQFNETLGDVEVPPVEETGMTSFRIGTILLTSGLYVSVDIVGVVACLLLSQSLLTVFLALMSCVTVITAITALSVWLGIRMTIIMLTLQLRAGIRLLDPATTTGRSWRTQELVSALWTTFHGWPRSSRQQSSPERQAAQAGDQELGMVSTLPIQAAPRTETLRV